MNVVKYWTDERDRRANRFALPKCSAMRGGQDRVVVRQGCEVVQDGRASQVGVIVEPPWIDVVRRLHNWFPVGVLAMARDPLNEEPTQAPNVATERAKSGPSFGAVVWRSWCETPRLQSLDVGILPPIVSIPLSPQRLGNRVGAFFAP